MRLARLFALLIGVTLAMQGARALGFVDQSCVSACDDDDADGRCPPNCGDCTCCSHLTPTTVPAVYMRPEPAVTPVRPTVATYPIPPSADPHELLHVPKAPRV